MTAQLKVSLTVGLLHIQHNSFDGLRVHEAVASFTSKSPNVSAIVWATGKAARQEETNVWQGNAKWIEKCVMRCQALTTFDKHFSIDS